MNSVIPIHHYSESKALIHFLHFCLQISQQLEVEYHRCTQGWWRSLCLPNIIISTKDFGDISQCQRLKISDFSYFFTYLLINIKSIFFCLFSHFCTNSLDLGVLQLLDDQNNDIILRSRYVVELVCYCLLASTTVLDFLPIALEKKRIKSTYSSNTWNRNSKYIPKNSKAIQSFHFAVLH